MLSTLKSQREGGGACAIAPARPCLFAERKGGGDWEVVNDGGCRHTLASRAAKGHGMVKDRAEAASQTHETKEGVKNG